MVQSELPLQLIGVVCAGLVIALFLGIGIFLLLRSRNDRQKAALSQGWPAVPGQILTAQVAQNTRHDSDGDTTVTYHPQVEYEYEVMGQKYLGNKVQLGLQVSTSNLKKTQEVVARYQPGSMVNVFYNPDNPGEAVLERRASTTMTVIIGVIFLAVGLCIGCPVAALLAYQAFGG